MEEAVSPLSGKMPIILRRIFSASLGCSQLVQHSDVPDHVVTLYELDSGKPGGSGGGEAQACVSETEAYPPFESLQREGCASVIDRIGECHADELPPDRLG